MKCRHCKHDLELSFANLGSSPPSNSYLSEGYLNHAEKWYPLHVKVCANCWLVQTVDYADREEFFSPDYAYFSSYSTTWLDHCQAYSDAIIKKLNLDENSLVGEVASNDGYLLQYFQKKNIPCFGVEPTISTAKVAQDKGIKVFTDFFGADYATKLALENYTADLLIANNVLAHVPDINDFVRGFSNLLKPNGVATFEFPHLLSLVNYSQFDTIYHEHYSYLSLSAVKKVFEKNGLSIFDIDEIPTHGGSLRVYAQHMDAGKREVSNAVGKMLELEMNKGITSESFYQNFQKRIINIKHEFLTFLLEAQQKQQKVVAYGAAAKGNTLLNYSGVKDDLISYVVDKNPAKAGKYLPGSRIPIVSESRLKNDKPDLIVILPWNLKDEITYQLDYVRSWGAKFVTAIPSLSIS